MGTKKTLWDALAEVPDPRQASGKRYELRPMLLLIAVAGLGGAKSMNAVIQFAQDRGEGFSKMLGLTRGRPPSGATYHLLLAALDHEAFERAISAWIRDRAGDDWRAISLDGKTLRGTRREKGKTDPCLPGVHLLAAYAPHAKAVVAQMRVDAKTNEHKAALEMLDLIPVEGKILTGDAMFCQKDLTAKIVKKRAITSSPSKRTKRV